MIYYNLSHVKIFFDMIANRILIIFNLLIYQKPFYSAVNKPVELISHLFFLYAVLHR